MSLDFLKERREDVCLCNCIAYKEIFGVSL